MVLPVNVRLIYVQKGSQKEDTGLLKKGCVIWDISVLKMT